MRKIVLLGSLLLLLTRLSAQTVVDTIPGTFWCPNDSFFLKYSNYSRLFPYRVSREDQVSPGTDASPGLFVTLYYGKDSLRLAYHNRLPYSHIFYVNFASPKGKTLFRLHFNQLSAWFPPDYRDRHRKDVQFDIPEAYELANIIWTLSPTGQRAKDLYKSGAYFQKMMRWFAPYRNHPLFKKLDFPDSLAALRYYEFRENSFAFRFRDTAAGATDTKLVFGGPYYYVYGEELADSSLFGKLLPLVEDFARKSRFRMFYAAMKPGYQNMINRERALLPVRAMWDWLEQQFPRRTYSSYRIVFSPLIGGSHSTQNYATYEENGWFTESVMFICGPGRYDTVAALTDRQREGLLSGVVFTEIDHNYVNPATNRFRSRVDSVFSNRALWARAGNSSDFYSENVSVFNEYMTHAVFCLYVQDHYDAETARFVINAREDLMVNRRNFIRFREFNRALLQLHAEHKDLTVSDLYPYVLDWCGRIDVSPQTADDSSLKK